MDFIHQLIRYYESEYKAGYFIGAMVGGVLLMAAILLFKFANPLSLLRGLTFPLLIAGVFMGIGGAGSGYYTQHSYAEKLKLYHKDKQEFFKQEVPKAEATHKSWFGIRVWWSIVAGAGVLLMLSFKKNYLMGVGLGLLLFGIIGHIEEAISFKRNERYYKAVRKAAAEAELNKDSVASVDPIKPADPVTQIKHDPKKEGSFSTPLAIKKIAGCAITSSLIEGMPVGIVENEDLMPDSLQAIPAEQQYGGSPAAVSPNFEIGEAAKDRRAGDYNGALLIRRNTSGGKHCWFKKDKNHKGI